MKKKEEMSSINQPFISLTSRQTSMICAALCIITGGTFLTGYFWGKKSAVMQFAQKAEQDSFADQIYASLCALYDYEPEVEDKIAQVEEQSEATEVAQVTELPLTELATSLPQEQVVVQAAENSCDDPVESIPADQQETISQCYAELVGFGSENSATLFANKLLEKGYEVAVKKRSSVTAKHKKVAWYQVVTQPYKDKDVLQEVVDRIGQEEKLKGIRIVFI